VALSAVARIGCIVGGLQLSLRERAGQIRRRSGGAVRASWTEYAIRPIGLSMAVAAFLGVIGAFGSETAPFWTREIVFVVLGLGISALIGPCIWVTERIPWLAARPLRRRLVIALVMTPLTALWIWASIGFAFLHGPKLAQLPEYLGYSLIMSFAMTGLSWAVFRSRPAAPAEPLAAPAGKFMERLPFRLRDGGLYAVEAEDHYLRVRTSKGSDLILMRFSDALLELQGVDGAQTHRSWWVAKAGVADVKRSDGRALLVLKDGAEAPVSRAQSKALREKGWL
jgi:hypothetical protein